MAGTKPLLAAFTALFTILIASLPASARKGDPVFSAALSQLSKIPPQERPYTQILSSVKEHGGPCVWKMCRIGQVTDAPEAVSSPGFDDSGWMDAIVPGTVLHSLVENGVYPDPYHGDNNKLDKGLIPDLAKAGRDFYAYWFRTSFPVPEGKDPGKYTWMQFDGVNYHTEVWINGRLVTTWSGMFWQEKVDISEFLRPGEENILAVKVLPIDSPGTLMGRSWGPVNEWHNGGDGWIGRNVAMLMTAGWDFTFYDGIRDRNTGIWRDIKIYTTREASLEYPFVRSELSHPDYTGITVEQFANRMLLREAMLRHGFKPLESEWWHFTLADEPYKDTYFDYPVTWLTNP